ncbi:MAG: metalloregulator ArsR/SmtB family transcription factor, partial [Planctomycetota bacterium JB042]
MESKSAVRAFAALAQESRLGVFRLLVRSAPEGVAAGVLAERLSIPASTLSFHLSHLVEAGLVRAERRGRSLVYSLEVGALHELLWFLGEDCCQGRIDLCSTLTGRIEERRVEAERAVDRETVLFVCSRNTARSQMAEAILRQEAGERYAARSGGIAPGPIHPLTLRVLEEDGVDVAGLAPNDLGDFLGKVPIHRAIVVCETANAHCPKIVPFAPRVDSWPFP